MTRFVDAETIAYIAHGADGATRADKVTPYIVHPRRVAELSLRFHALVPLDIQSQAKEHLSNRILWDAAMLHDVLEDTKLTSADLSYLGVEEDTLNVVELLTKKKPNEPAPPEYYQAISSSLHALVVKCADRCANLEDSLKEVQETRSLKRWKNYVHKTYKDVLPMYFTLPALRAELQNRLSAIEEAIVEANFDKDMAA